MAKIRKKPHVLVIMDGIGERDDDKDNAVKIAHTPTLDDLKKNYPYGLVSASGIDVGLPLGQFGNSEVGHMNLGAGRILYQDITKIDAAIDDGTFFANEALRQTVGAAIACDGAVQVLGLLSDGGVHAHQNHMIAICRLALASGASQVYVHAFLDGRDTPPKSAKGYLSWFNDALETLNQEFAGTAKLASIVGRFFAMDRDHRWERIQQSYRLLVMGEGVTATDADQALALAYERGESDEFVHPTLIDDNGIICDNDAVIFANFRADRARQLSQALLLNDNDFDGFIRNVQPSLAAFASLTHYSDELSQHKKVAVAYPPDGIKNSLGEYLSLMGKTQLRLAETEKYPHVSFFFSGGQETPFAGETRIVVESPKVETYDQCPQMNARGITDVLLEALDRQDYDVLVVNYANGDMVGHTGDLSAAVCAVETVDSCLGEVVSKVLALDGDLLVTADHGNCEQMFDYESNQPHTQHTTELVPFIYVSKKTDGVYVREGGKLCDIAPTILELLGLDKPSQMSGNSLLGRR